MIKKLLSSIAGLIGMLAFWVIFLAYLWFWGFILDFFEKLFKSGDPLGWSGVVAMFFVLYTGLVIYGGIKFIVEKIKKRKELY